MTDKDMISLETLSGIKYINIYKTDGKVTSAQVNMGSPMLKSRDIPALIESDTVIFRPLEVGEKVYSVTCLSMGNPHCVVFSENIDSINIQKIGAEFENHPVFPDRINTGIRFSRFRLNESKCAFGSAARARPSPVAQARARQQSPAY